MSPDQEGNKIFVYADADISLQNMHPEALNPTSLYLILNGLEFQRDLRQHLLEQYDIDTLRLDNGYVIKNEDKQVTLLPPVIEVMRESVVFNNDRGDKVYDQAHVINTHIITDGLHRVALARALGIKPKVIIMRGIPYEHPFYAYPNNWEDISIFDGEPETKEQKKLYRREDCYALYRDFGVLDVGVPRHTGKGKRVMALHEWKP